MWLLKLTFPKPLMLWVRPFLLKTLAFFGFNNKFCKWIHVILQHAFLSLGMNINKFGFFKCSNGVRKGYPHSLILFFLPEEVLSRRVSKLVAENRISLIKGSRHYKLPYHTLYADDIMIFCIGDQKYIKVIANLISNYASCSGQICNASKSLIYAGEMTSTKHTKIV